MGEKPVALKDFPVIGGDLHVPRIEHVVDRDAHGPQRTLEPDFFGIGVIGDEIGHLDARIVKDNLPQRDAFGKAHAPEHAGAPDIDVRTGLDQRIEIRGRDHLGQQRCRGQKRLGFILPIGAALLVLDDQNPQRLPGPQDRYAKKREIGVFPGFGAIGKGGVFGRVLERERFGFRRDQPHEPFAQLEGRHVHRLALETVGCEQFERTIIAQDIERAHIGPHVGGDEIDDLVEPFLAGQRLGHGLAQLA